MLVAHPVRQDLLVGMLKCWENSPGNLEAAVELAAVRAIFEPAVLRKVAELEAAVELAVLRAIFEPAVLRKVVELAAVRKVVEPAVLRKVVELAVLKEAEEPAVLRKVAELAALGQLFSVATRQLLAWQDIGNYAKDFCWRWVWILQEFVEYLNYMRVNPWLLS
ncbi:hypothetical protein EPA93_21555 [Ktedonosporobacter rubrisoli]|uniref:Uncharacterized protein n=1 Tax=Ktedonosporobacter rubrisoli TaxID=2509675 RepID=A0A4V0YZ45_KTERU|nr:hypothetical protein [Ktedonosporobacter rubrisoli]QBD78441.1 hypothetical protein EPA93_21555 [Ktedonosporobacter rubrisoli]